jgi:hypothetical protein
VEETILTTKTGVATTTLVMKKILVLITEAVLIDTTAKITAETIGTRAEIIAKTMAEITAETVAEKLIASKLKDQFVANNLTVAIHIQNHITTNAEMKLFAALTNKTKTLIKWLRFFVAKNV